MKGIRISWPFVRGLLLLACTISSALGQGSKAFDVSAHVQFIDLRMKDGQTTHRQIVDGNLRTVVWLEPEDEKNGSHFKVAPGSFTMVQQNKEFLPHFLVIPAGSVVSFPNRDPFFHNVFSFFNGKRFDLGLYQSGQTRTVTFNRIGVSYIFCNIHPEMAAVIITLDTPYYAIPNAHGDLAFQGVREGNYRLHVWSENTSPDKLKAIEQNVTITAGHTRLDDIAIPIIKNTLENHTNKFGQPYDTHNADY